MPLDTTVKYLIQHSETREYLCPSADGSSIKTKALSNSEKDQSTYQWTLDLKSKGYLIKNVAHSRLLVPGSGSDDIVPAILEAPSTSGETFKWTISPQEVDKDVQLTLQVQETYFLYKVANKDVMLSFDLVKFRNHQSWILILATLPKAVVPSLLPMKNPLPNGSYRIRTFNGSYLLTMPSNAQPQTHQDQNIYVSKRQSEAEAAKFQRWEAELIEDSGLYTIKNSGTGLYLGPLGVHWLQGDFLVGLTNAFSKWTIQTTDMGVMFFIGLLGRRPLSIGFPNYEGGDLSEVQLEPSDSVPSQIWFFESLDVNSAAPSQDAIHSMSNLEAKDYYIRSCHEDGIYLFLDHGRVKLQGSAPISKFTLVYPRNNSGGFTLSIMKNNEPGYLTDALGLLDLRYEKPTTWVAIPHESDNETVYHICDAATGLKAISSRHVKGDDVVVDRMAATDEVQWWKFEAAH